MPTIEEMRAALKSSGPSVDEMRSALKQQNNAGKNDSQDMMSMVKSLPVDVLQKVGQGLDRLGPAQLRNIISLAIDQSQFKPSDVSAGDLITGSNAPSFADISKRAGVKDVNFNLQSNAENIQGFGTTPQLSQQEQSQLKQTEATIPTSELTGAALDFTIGNKASGLGIEAVSKSLQKAGQIAKSAANSSAVNKVGETLTNLTAKAGETMTGIPRENVKQYITNNKEINAIIAKNGGDMTQAADELRANLQSGLRSKIMSLNNDIKSVVLNSGDAAAPKEKVIEALQKAKEAVNPVLFPDSIAEIDSMISKVDALSDAKGMISGKNMSDIKGFFQDAAKGTYLKGGQVFSSSSQAQSAAKQAGREARKLEIGSMPGTAQPNLELARIHNLEKNINKNLITPERSDAALLAAGAGQNQRNVKNLEKIGNIIGQDAIGEARKLSTAQQFAKPQWTPTDTTGKSFARIAAGGIIGTAVFGPLGSVLGLAAASPAALKTAINSGKISKDFIAKIAGSSGEVTDAVLNKAIKIAGTKEGRTMISALVNQSSNEPEKTGNAYPMIVRNPKTQQKATLFDDQDLKEAKAKGFK